MQCIHIFIVYLLFINVYMYILYKHLLDAGMDKSLFFLMIWTVIFGKVKDLMIFKEWSLILYSKSERKPPRGPPRGPRGSRGPLVVVRLGPRRAERGPDSKFGEAWADRGPSPPLLPSPFPLFTPLEAPKPPFNIPVKDLSLTTLKIWIDSLSD
jgi:hypothetical protein